jgi:multiple sugar transport system ATP-binding protein
MAGLTLRNVEKQYDDGYVAVKDFNLDVEDGEFIVFVGPSGCGKSTTLRMIAGLEEITKGEVHINDRLVNNLAPSDRNIAMVFQNYALYGHLTTYENIGFSLTIQHQSLDEIHGSVLEAAEVVNLSDVLNRKPGSLSGGQRQRVALGRSIVRDADIFLLDEPLSNLDAKLRVSTRHEIVKLHQQLGVTFIYVTHDQVEAMTMADRIVVMNEGYIQQVGTTFEVYHSPANLFVADFIGSPSTNLLKGTLDQSRFISPRLSFNLTKSQKEAFGDLPSGKEVTLGIRPEMFKNISVLENAANEDYAVITVTPHLIEMLGADSHVHFTMDGMEMTAKVPSSRHDIRENEEMSLAIDLSKVYFFDNETTNRMLYKEVK